MSDRERVVVKMQETVFTENIPSDHQEVVCNPMPEYIEALSLFVTKKAPAIFP